MVWGEGSRAVLEDVYDVHQMLIDEHGFIVGLFGLAELQVLQNVVQQVLLHLNVVFC